MQLVAEKKPSPMQLAVKMKGDVVSNTAGARNKKAMRHHRLTSTIFLVDISPMVEQDLQDILPSLFDKMQSIPF